MSLQQISILLRTVSVHPSHNPVGATDRNILTIACVPLGWAIGPRRTLDADTFRQIQISPPAGRCVHPNHGVTLKFQSNCLTRMRY